MISPQICIVCYKTSQNRMNTHTFGLFQLVLAVFDTGSACLPQNNRFLVATGLILQDCCKMYRSQLKKRLRDSSAQAEVARKLRGSSAEVPR